MQLGREGTPLRGAKVGPAPFTRGSLTPTCQAQVFPYRMILRLLAQPSP